jgi:hypothetical protein
MALVLLRIRHHEPGRMTPSIWYVERYCITIYTKLLAAATAINRRAMYPFDTRARGADQRTLRIAIALLSSSYVDFRF